MKTAKALSRLYLHAFAAVALSSTLVGMVASHLLYNWTESLPLGLYWLSRRTHPQRHELVAFPVPPHVQRLVYERHYLPEGALLVKPVIALPGDVVCTKEGVLTLNGNVLGSLLHHDTEGRELPQDESCGPVPEGQLYVASHHPRSFDSRTFGPISLTSVRGTVTPLWTY